MKPKTLMWDTPREDVYITANNFPQLHYQIRQIAVGPVYGVHFFHGFIDGLFSDQIVAKASTVEEAMREAQKHWDKYVTQNFLEG